VTNDERFDVYRKSSPTCPHCGYELTLDDMVGHDPDLFDLAHTEDQASVECPSCDQPFWVQGGYTPYYTSAFAEEDL
jgi:hypothetical protein